MRRPAALFFAAMVLATGCSSDDGNPTEDGSGTDGDATSPLSVVTFNVGLAFGYVEEASGRKDAVIAALAESDADVICLQELWTNQDETGAWTTNVIDEVLAGTQANFPEQYWSRTTTSSTAPPLGCSVEEAQPLEDCAVASCGDIPPENLADCVLGMCADAFDATSAGCQSCLASNLGSPLEDIIAACKGVISSGVVYDGHNGLAILSKHPLTTTSIEELDYALTARAILHATVSPPDADPVELYCTHLAADLSSSIAYPPNGAYTSFAEENAAQSQSLLQYAADTATAPTVLLAGDFNDGPQIGTGTAELPDNYQLVLDGGFADPIAEAGTSCSFCEANTLQLGSGTGGQLIDHVFVQGTAQVVDASIVYDEPVAVVTADGSTQMLNLSDHYGVRVNLLH